MPGGRKLRPQARRAGRARPRSRRGYGRRGSRRCGRGPAPGCRRRCRADAPGRSRRSDRPARPVPAPEPAAVPVALTASSPPSTTNTSRWPIWRSQAAAIRARTPVSSISTMRALRTPIQVSVACTSWPPGALRLPGRWPARNSAGSRTSSTYSVRSGSSSNRVRSSGPMTPTPDCSANAWARCSASAAVFGVPGWNFSVAAAVAAQPGQFPAHRAVAQRHHLVGNAGAAQALGAQDAAGAAGAVDHHQRLRIGHDVADAIGQFAARHADPGRDRHAGEFLQRAAVQHHHVAPGIDPGLQFRRIDAFGAVVVLHPFAERLGRDVDAAEQHVAGGFPGLGAAVQHRDVGAADGFQPAGQRLGQAAPVIDAADPHRLSRGSSARARISLRARPHGHRPEQMRGAELAVLPRIQQGEFLPVGDPAMQCVGADAVHVRSPPVGPDGSAEVDGLATPLRRRTWRCMDSMLVFDRPPFAATATGRREPCDQVADVLRDAAERLLDRLDDTNRRFADALDVGGRGVVAPLLRARGHAGGQLRPVAGDGGAERRAVRRGGRGVPAVRAGQLRPDRRQPVAALDQRPAGRAAAAAPGAAARRACCWPACRRWARWPNCARR